MENFFIRSVRHIPIRDSFLWCGDYIIEKDWLFKDGNKLHNLSFQPTLFQVLEHNILLFDHKDLFVLDKDYNQDFVGSMKSEPELVSFSSKESLILIVTAQECLLFDLYFELINTFELISSICNVVWNFRANLIYCSSVDSILVFNTNLELQSRIMYGGYISLKSPNILGIASENMIRFVERNGLEYGQPLEINEKNKDSGKIKAINFIDRNTLVVITDYVHLYFSKNSKWYRKIMQKVDGKFLGFNKNLLIFDKDGIFEISIFKEFTKSGNKFFVIDGFDLLVYDYNVSIVPPPFSNKVITFSGVLVDVSGCGDSLAVLTYHRKQDADVSNKIASAENHYCLMIYDMESFEFKSSVDISSIKYNIIEILLTAKGLLIRTFENYLYLTDETKGLWSKIEIKETVIKTYFFTELVFLDSKGCLYQISNNMDSYKLIIRMNHDDNCRIMYQNIFFEDENYFIQINSKIFFNRFFVENVVSFLLHRGFLVITKHDCINIVKIIASSDKNTDIGNNDYPCSFADSIVIEKSFSQNINPEELHLSANPFVAERNAIAMTYCKSLILYIPRGSIESFEIAPIIVKDIRRYIMQECYEEAMYRTVKNCIPFRVWFDTRINLPRLAKIKLSQLISFFGDVFSLLGIQNRDSDEIISGIINRRPDFDYKGLEVSESVIEDFRRIEIINSEQPTENVLFSPQSDPVDTFLRIFEFFERDMWVEVLSKIGLYQVALFISKSLDGFVNIAKAYTNHDEIIKKSLMIYDLDISSKISLMLNKRNYIKEFESLRGENQKFRILDYLKMYEKALDCILSDYIRNCKTSDSLNDRRETLIDKESILDQMTMSFDEILDGPDDVGVGEDFPVSAFGYIEKNNLYDYSMKYNRPEFISFYARKSFRLRNYEKSFELYQRINMKKAFKVSFCLKSLVSIEIAKELNVLNKKFYRILMKSLVEKSNFDEAACIKRDFLDENATNYFLMAKKPLEALKELKDFVFNLDINPENVTKRTGQIKIDKNLDLSSLDSYSHTTFKGETLAEHLDLRILGSRLSEYAFYRTFREKIKELLDETDKKLQKKSQSIKKYSDRKSELINRPQDFTQTTFSYSFSGKSIKMNEEEFIEKRLLDLKSELLSLKINDLCTVVNELEICSNISKEYDQAMEYL